MSDIVKVKLPTMEEIVKQSEETIKENELMVLLNQPPPEQWLLGHPFISGHLYLPIGRVEYLLNRIYTKWWVEVLETQILANSVTCTVRLFVVNPLTKEIEHNDGVGAAPIQTDKDAGAMDWNKAKASGVQMAAPAAKSYAFKDAAESFGKVFGKDVSRKTQIDYNSLLKSKGENKKPVLTNKHAKWAVAKESVSKGTTIEELRINWEVSDETYMELCL